MTRREWRGLGLVLAVAVSLRLALFWVLPRENLVSDEPEYLAAAAWLAQGRGFSFYAEWPWLRPPLYLLFLAPFLHCFGPDLLPIRLAQVALSLAVPGLTYLLGRRMFGRQTALAAGLITALWLPLAVLPHLLLAENLLLPLLLGAFYCLVRLQGDLPQRDEGAKVGGHEEPKTRGNIKSWCLGDFVVQVPPPVVRILAGGALLGLATLCRGLTLGFLPLAALWVGWVVWGKRPEVRWGVALRPALLALAAAVLVILPWSAYSTLRYGGPILVDTTGGYNFWLGTQGGQFRNLREVNRILLALPHPAARQAYAYQQGWEAVRADPGAFLRHRLGELGQLLAINYGADERLADGFVQGAVSVPHLLALLVLEDTLYVLLVPAALLGLFLRRGEPGRGLALLWLGYNLLLAATFFAINRFRLPLLPFLGLYAAALLPVKRRTEPTRPRRRAWMRLAAAIALVAAFWAVVLPSYLGPYPASWGATLLGLQGRAAAEHLARAEQSLAGGDLAAAWQEIEPALAYRPDGLRPLNSARVVQAEWLRAGGDDEAALLALAGMDWHQAVLLRGDIFRARGDLAAARAVWSGRDLAERNPTAWAWEHLRPPAGGEVDVGGGLDWGLVDGFYAAESEGQATYRWSGPVARLRFPRAGSGRMLALTLRLRGWRPAGERPADVTVAVNGTDVGRFTATGEWQEVTLTLPPAPAGEDVVITLRSTTFLAGPRDLLTTGQLRTLGLMVDWGKVR